MVHAFASHERDLAIPNRVGDAQSDIFTSHEGDPGKKSSCSLCANGRL